MRYTIKSTDDGCSLTATDFHTETVFPVPAQAANLTAAWATLLQDPDRNDVTTGRVLVVRTPTGISIEHAAGKFAIPYSHLFSVMGAL
jgi:hypothetical protein